jgi:hypothetical protein
MPCAPSGSNRNKEEDEEEEEEEEEILNVISTVWD